MGGRQRTQHTSLWLHYLLLLDWNRLAFIPHPQPAAHTCTLWLHKASEAQSTWKPHPSNLTTSALSPPRVNVEFVFLSCCQFRYSKWTPLQQLQLSENFCSLYSRPIIWSERIKVMVVHKKVLSAATWMLAFWERGFLNDHHFEATGVHLHSEGRKAGREGRREGGRKT